VSVLYFSHHPTFFSSTSHHQFSKIHVPATSTNSSLQLQSPFSPSALHLITYSSETRCTFITAFSSLFAHIILSALYSWPRSHFHTPLLTHATFTFPLNFNDASFLVKISDSSLKFPNVQRTLATDAEFALPPRLSAYPPDSINPVKLTIMSLCYQQ